MKVKNATIEIRPRGVTELVDLAFLFYRARLPVLVWLLLILGVPIIGISMGIHYLTGQAWIAVLFFWLMLHLPTGAVVLAASRFVFGAPLGVRDGLSIYKPLWAGFFFRVLGQKFLMLVLSPIVVGYILKLKWVFTPMVVLLERLAGRPLAVRRSGLYRRGGASAFGLDILLKSLGAVMVCGIILVAELFLTEVLSVFDGEGLFSAAVMDDPVRLGIWMLTILLVSPVTSLSWFFLYLNARIRGEGWDLELGLRAAAAKISSDDEVAA